MRPDRWDDLERIFHAAAELADDERWRYLDEACAGEPELREQVERLLAHDDPTTGYLDTPPLRGSRSRRTDRPDPLVGRAVGPYRLDERIAEGGMGVVYRARRDDDLLDYVVAVKLVRFGMEDEQNLERFRTECHALSFLDHPHIARLLDGGVSEDGRPYLVMEYVEGVALDEFCDEQRLTIRERLALFRKVCDAVHYAHQNLIVHRDLKPSNVLVTCDGNPKLLDFGLAKVLDDESMAERERTATAARMLTPDYASPEQIRGEVVTTASDIYSLGVILFRLLTGRGPYRLASTRADEIQNAVCRQDPTRPSTAVLRTGGDQESSDDETRSAAESANRRRTNVDRLRRVLRGDLDNIVLMAMRKEPERRYASAEQLSGDIWRHLAGLPVIARKDTIAYRTSTFVRRHRIAVLSGAVVFLALTGGIFVSAHMARLASAQRDAAQLAEERATADATHARIEADSASEIATLLVDVLQANAPRTASGAHAIMDGLDREVERVRRQYADRRHIQANLIDSVGIVYMQIGAYDRAETLMQEAQTLRRDEFGDESLEIARSFTSLGKLRFERGRPEEAAEFFRAALDLHRRLPADVHTDIAEAANNLAVTLRGLGQTDEAEKLHLEALALRRSISQRAPVVAESLNNLAGIYIGRGDYDAAETALREALSIRQEILGDHHPLTAQTTSNLAVTLHQAGDLDGAEELYRQSLATQRVTATLDEGGLVATLTTLADLLRTRRVFDEADVLLQEALDTQLRLTGPDHLQVAVVRAQCARLHYVRADHEAARSEWDEVLRIRRLSLPEDHILIGQSLSDYGLVLIRLGELEGSESALRQAVAIYGAALPPEHWQQGIVASCLAECLIERGRYDEAETLLRTAHDLLERTRGDDSVEAVRVASMLDRLAGRRSAETANDDDAP